MEANDGKTINFEVDGVQASIFYHEAGDPLSDTVIFLHTGGAGVTAYVCWHANMDVFADAGYHVYAPDFPGFGRSSPVSGSGALLAFMDALGIQRAHLIGDPNGSMGSFRLTIEHPERVKSMTTSGGEPRIETDESQGIVQKLGTTPRMNFAREMLAKPELSLDDMRRATADFFFDRGHPAVDRVARMRMDALSDAGLLQRVRNDAVAQMRRGRSITDAATFAGIKTPVFLLHGRDEQGFYSEKYAPVLMDASLKTISAIPNCRCTILPNCGHWPQLEKPDTYNALVLQFLAEIEE